MKTAFIFPGQGSQKISMGKDFFQNFTEAKNIFLEVDEAIKQNLSDLIFNGDAADLTRTENAQPALMAVSLAIINVIKKEKNIKDVCSYLAGHSLGEYSSLATSESLSIYDTAKILKIRGEAFRDEGLKTKGAMAAIIGADIELVEKIVAKAGENDICQIANDNSIGQIVISGTENAILKSLDIAKEMGARKAIKLPVSGAFHSELIAKAGDKVRKGLENITINTPQIPIIANVTADLIKDKSEISDLLVRQVTSRVRWTESVLKLKELGITDIVEIGSGNVLTGLIRRIDKTINCHNISNVEDLDKVLPLI